MTRKFPRNPLEIAFQELEDLDRQITGLTNRKEVTLPFRDLNHLPPGVEGQVVLAEYVPIVIVEGVVEIITYSVSGELSISTGNLRFYALSDGTVEHILISVGTACTGGGVGVSVNLYKNGSFLHALTIGNTFHVADEPLAYDYVTGDYFTINITAVGTTTPGEDLVVELQTSSVA